MQRFVSCIFMMALVSSPCSAQKNHQKIGENILFKDVFENKMDKAFQSPPDPSALHRTFASSNSVPDKVLQREIKKALSDLGIQGASSKRIECRSEICEICYVIPIQSIPERRIGYSGSIITAAGDKIRGLGLVHNYKTAVLYAKSNNGNYIGFLGYLFK